MQNKKLSEEDVQKFMQGCEDLMRLGGKFTTSIRQAVADLKSAYDPALKSQYVEQAVVELLTRSLQDFEKKVEANLEGIDKICTKGGKWFAFYLGRTVERDLPDEATPPSTAGEVKMFEARKEPTQLVTRPRHLTKKLGS
ncbi:MAG: hypothetical protein L0387_04415 [Acidobacteria bacterium]|nr:hypothetical protein [Acidobacteriota bacterium]MCI0720370.1 hypothetical protein [Acidobacteriota bacterium]